ncbi:hypothetical protein BDZ97DRAFT_2059156 [Flammula alnicola]|nr:hypothetical protein BDZ97DRAFT_2059156 [Flammula alnicola]
MFFRHGGLTRRDALLLLVGASSMHIWSLLFSQPAAQSDQSIFINTQVSQPNAQLHKISTVTTTAIAKQTQTKTQTVTATATVTNIATPTSKSRAVLPFDELPPTEVLAHAPGWTLFRNLYMSNGTLLLVADEEGRKNFPEIRMMTSTGLAALNTPENIAQREPTDHDMRIISPQEAKTRWVYTGKGGKEPGLNRVWSVEGNTLLFNDPSQFLRHYYHFVAELFFGVQAFWHGAFSLPLPSSESNALSPSSSSIHYTTTHPAAPPIHRAIFAHANADGWRDDPGFNAYFLRAALPSLIVEHQEDWTDRIRATRPVPSGNNPTQGQDSSPEDRAWHFPLVLLADRSAAHRGVMCGSTTQRTASEAWDYMRVKGKLRGVHVGGWWAPLREAVWRFAGAEEGVEAVSRASGAGGSGNSNTPLRDTAKQQQPMAHFGFGVDVTDVVGLDSKAPVLDASASEVVDVGIEHQKKLPMPKRVVISYISRQSARNRKLVEEDHDVLVKALEALVERKNGERKAFLEGFGRAVGVDDDGDDDGVPPLEWELSVLQAEKMSKDEQIRAAARTTIMLGVHGNGLTHLVFMNPKRASTVIEIFYPGGFAHDYYWTARSLGMSHFAVWNDTHRSYPDKPDVDYPDGFQENAIPVHGPTVAQLIEDRVAGKL